MANYVRRIWHRFLYKPNTKTIHWDKVISTFVVLTGFIIFTTYNQKRINKKEALRNASPRYTIGNVTATNNNLRGSRTVDYYYHVLGKGYEKWNHYSKLSFDINAYGGRYFVKFYSEDPSNAIMLFKCPVPENIKLAPWGGWDKLPVTCDE